MQGGLIGEAAGAAAGKRAGSAWQALWLALALAHLFAVAALFVVFRLWPLAGWAAFLLYAPRALFAAPAVLTAALLRGRWRLLPALTAAVVFGPLMGLHVNGPGHRGELRVLTWNLWFGAGDMEAVRDTLVRADPDIIVAEAIGHRVEPVLRAPPFADHHLMRSTQYAVVSRWPVQFVQEDTPSPDGWRSWAWFSVDAPLGRVDVFAVHPHSPRALLRGGVRRGMRGDRAEMAYLRDELRALDQVAAHAGPLRILAGDFNIPEQAAIALGLFAGMKDAFVEKGNGYGYTFPTVSRLPPWMRLDRLVVGPGWRLTGAQIAGLRGSDHAAVVADVERAAP